VTQPNEDIADQGHPNPDPSTDAGQKKLPDPDAPTVVAAREEREAEEADKESKKK
jgi:hypothetical protein